MEKLFEEKFIRLDGKKPITPFNKPLNYRQADECDDIGLIVMSPYVVIDVDKEVEYELLLKIVNKLNIKTRVMKTTRGGHFWFTSGKPLKNSVDINTALSINIDIRSHGKHSQCQVKSGGVWRDWVVWNDDVEELPYWLTPINHKESFFNMGNGSGRNDKLFSYIITLTNAGLSRDQVRDTIRIINEHLFSDQLDEGELSSILRDQAFEDLHDNFFVGRTFQHDTFSRYFANDNNVYLLNDRLYMYNAGFYSDHITHMHRRMIDYIPTLTQRQRGEVTNYLHLIADIPKEKSPYHIVTNNGLIDVRSEGIQPYSPNVFTTNKINAYYDEDAYCEAVDKTLNKMCKYDPELRLLMEELIGYCLLPTARFQKAFILSGEGSNGKSTFMDMLIDFLGNENVSSLSMKELNHNFKLSEITSKLANIGDDISAEYIDDSSIFKKLVTGEDITVDKKNEQPYKLRNTAKLIFAANSLPMAMDKSDGFMRRLTIIPFNARFTKDDIDFDPFIGDKLVTDEAHSYLLNIGLKGAMRLFENNTFTEPQSVIDIITQYTYDNNNVLGFIDERSDLIDGAITGPLYDEYTYWCAQYGHTPYQIRKFNSEIRTHTPYTTSNVNRNNKTVQTWGRKKV